VNLRRVGLVAALGVSVAGLVSWAATPRRVAPTTFAELAPPGMPVAPTSAAITSSWFCPGSPNSSTRAGEVVVTNPGDVVLHGRLTVYSTSGAVAGEPIDVGPRDSATFPLAQVGTGDYLSATAELDGAPGYVEQAVRLPSGRVITQCANAASSDWYFADGSTRSSSYQLIITNPFPDYTNVSISLATAEGTRTPAALQNQTLAGHSVLHLDLAQFGVADEAALAVQLHASPLRVVVGRAQDYQLGLGRTGFTMTLGAPSTDNLWMFPDGDKSPGVTESLSLFNPSTSPATVTVDVYTGAAPASGFVASQQVELAEGAVTSVDIDALAGLPAGPHALVVNSGSTGVIVEQVTTRGTSSANTSVVSGARISSTRWWIPTPVTLPTTAALAVFNQTSSAGTVSVLALGPGGLLGVPGLQNLALPAADNFVGGVLSIDLTSAESLGLPLVVESNVDIVVGRRLLRAAGSSARSAVLALPES